MPFRWQAQLQIPDWMKGDAQPYVGPTAVGLGIILSLLFFWPNGTGKHENQPTIVKNVEAAAKAIPAPDEDPVTQPQSEQSRVRAIVEQMYSSRIKFGRRSLDEMQPYLSAELYYLLKFDDAREEPGIDYDPFEMAQDYRTGFRVGEPSITGTSATIVVDLAPFNNDSKFEQVILMLARQENGEWKISDLASPDETISLKEMLLNPVAANHENESDEENDAEIEMPQINNSLIITTGQIIPGSGVKLREKPSVSGKMLGVLKQSSEVIILSQEGPEEEIEGIKANWFAILVDKNLLGWAFGGFIGNIREHELPDKVPEEIMRFTVNFFEDSGFQEKHIRFPLKVVSETPDGKEVSMLSQGGYESPLTIRYREAVETAFFLPTADSFALRIRGKGCGIIVYYIFNTIENSIFLVEIRDYSV
ncbi:MAG: hypothetical protein ACD_39C00538G0006 [uncultured bacterium]|nr:MAG: hypothetical protein ACD_39C00538G0006 [uncultured bacterium]